MRKRDWLGIASVLFVIIVAILMVALTVRLSVGQQTDERRHNSGLEPKFSVLTQYR